jgi:hypothetical protein
MSNFKLNGEYKYTIFDSQKNIKKESEYFSNFITSDGLKFIYFTGFAHNLEYLSLGSSNAHNSLYTTGLSAPINDFQYFTGFLSNSVGTQVNPSGLSFYKTWLLPSPTSGVSKNYTVREFMVSPASGGDFFQQGTGYFSRAFSRATGLAELVTGDFLSVTYRLNVSHDTGIKTFLNVVTTGSSNKFTDSYKSFNYFSGIYSLMQPALKVLLPIEGASEQPEGEIGEVKQVEYLGMGMEPSCPAQNLFCYFSEDEAQFLVTPSGVGGANSSYSLSSGVHKYLYNAPVVMDSIKENIRWSGFLVPSTGNITVNDSIGETGIHKNSTSSIPALSLSIAGTGRQRHLFRTFGWIGASTPDLINYQWKSMVLGYQKPEDPESPEVPPDGKEIVPYVDCLLGTSLGELRPQKYVYNDQGIKTGWLYNTGDYLNLDSNNNLTLSFKLSWSAPCGDATGCY